MFGKKKNNQEKPSSTKKTVNKDAVSFFRVSNGKITRIDNGANAPLRVFLAPFKTMSVNSFKFPFSGATEIREALKLQTNSYSSGTNEIQIFPVVTGKEHKVSTGFSCFISNNELSDMSDKFEYGIIIPAPFCLSSAVNGNGITVWADEDTVCSVFWSGNVPSLYHYKKRQAKLAPLEDIESISEKTSFLEEAFDSTPVKKLKKKSVDGEQPTLLKKRIVQPIVDRSWDVSDEIALMMKLTSSKILPDATVNTYIYDATDEFSDTEILRKSFLEISWLKKMNLSSKVLNNELMAEKHMKKATKLAIWSVLLGLIFSIGSYISYSTEALSLSDIRAKTEFLYRNVFDKTGNLVDAVSQARTKISDLTRTGGGTSKELEVLLEDISVSSEAITIDSLRYNNDGADITGSVTDINSIQAFRTAITDKFTDAILGDLQQIPGGGFRFNLSLKY